jgi:hypothetical protein
VLLYFCCVVVVAGHDGSATPSRGDATPGLVQGSAWDPKLPNTPGGDNSTPVCQHDGGVMSRNDVDARVCMCVLGVRVCVCDE